jgi:hypothetical protein
MMHNEGKKNLRTVATHGHSTSRDKISVDGELAEIYMLERFSTASWFLARCFFFPGPIPIVF